MIIGLTQRLIKVIQMPPASVERCVKATEAGERVSTAEQRREQGV